MSFASDNSKIIIPKRLFFLYINVFLIPFFVSWVTLVHLRIFDIKETLIGFTSPVAIIGITLVYAFVLFWWFSQTRLLQKFNPNDPKSVDRTNRVSRRFQSVTLITGVLNAFLSALIVQGAFASKNVFVDVAPLYTTCIGNVFLIAQAFYTLFVQHFERSLKVLPFRGVIFSPRGFSAESSLLSPTSCR